MMILENDLVDNRIGIFIGGSDGHYEGNTVIGGEMSISLLSNASPTLVDNTVESSGTSGLFIGSLAAPTLERNRICSNGDAVVHESGDTASVDSSNEICEVAIE
jgi:parallel beta-helix repeat protein